MDTLRFALALEVEGMDPEQAFILAQEIYRLYAHSVLGGVYQSMDYGVFDTLRIKADLTRTKEEAMTNVLRAMNAEDADQEKYRDGEMKRIDAERRQARVHQVVTGMATVVADDLPVDRRVSRSAAHRQDRLLALDPLRSFVNAAMRTGIARTRGVLHFEEIDTIAERKGDAGKDERVTWPVTDRNAAWPMGGLYGG